MSTAADARAAFTHQVSPKVPHCVASILSAASTDKAQFKLHAIHAVTPAGATQLKAGWRIRYASSSWASPPPRTCPTSSSCPSGRDGRAITDLLVTGSDKESGNVAALHRHLQRLVAARLKTAFP